jgi:hypothetical protein
VLVIPHGPDRTQVDQIYEAKPGDFLGPGKAFAEQVPERHIHKNEEYHNRQKKGNEHFNSLKKGIQNIFHQLPLIFSYPLILGVSGGKGPYRSFAAGPGYPLQ